MPSDTPETTRMLNATGSGKCQVCGAPRDFKCEACTGRETTFGGIRIIESSVVPPGEIWISMPGQQLMRFKTGETSDAG